MRLTSFPLPAGGEAHGGGASTTARTWIKAQTLPPPRPRSGSGSRPVRSSSGIGMPTAYWLKGELGSPLKIGSGPATAGGNPTESSSQGGVKSRRVGFMKYPQLASCQVIPTLNNR